MLPGVDVDCFYTWAPRRLPDFWSMTPDKSLWTHTLSHNWKTGFVMDCGRHNDVSVLFTGFVDIPFTGLWTFGLGSDNGSRMWIGNELVVDNDGDHWF